MFLVMDTITDKQHYKCKILSHYNMENISVSTLVFRSSKRKGKLLFLQILKGVKNFLAKWIVISKNQLIQTFIMIQSQNPDTHIHHYFLYVCVRESRAELSSCVFPCSTTTTTCLNFVKERYCVGWFITLLSRSPSLFGSTEIEPTKTLL